MPQFAEGDWVKLANDISGSPFKEGQVGQVLTVLLAGDEPAYEVDIKSNLISSALDGSGLPPVFEEHELVGASMGEILAAGAIHTFGTIINEQISPRTTDSLASQHKPDTAPMPSGSPPPGPAPDAPGDSNNASIGPLLLLLPFLFPSARKAASDVFKVFAIIFLVFIAGIILMLIFAPHPQ
jgi:hypothetical protein